MSPNHRSNRPRLSGTSRSEEHTSELQSQSNLVCRLLLEKKKKHRYKCGQHRSEDTRHGRRYDGIKHRLLLSAPDASELRALAIDVLVVPRVIRLIELPL